MKKFLFLLFTYTFGNLSYCQVYSYQIRISGQSLTVNLISSTSQTFPLSGANIEIVTPNATLSDWSGTLGQDASTVTGRYVLTYGSLNNLTMSAGVPFLLGSYTINGSSAGISIENLYLQRGGVDANVTGSILLPITLKSFTASKLEGNNALLNWSTASEVDASHFELERSFDLQSWTTIDKQAARGQQGIETSYSFVDQNIIAQRSNDGVCYYRLGMVDLDLSRKTSDIRSINLDPLKETYYQTFPNPAKGVINVQLQVPNTQANMTDLFLMDNTGRVHTKTAVSTNGITKIDVSDLPKGVYHLQVNTGTELLSKKVILVEN